jgi:hypothetical protein
MVSRTYMRAPPLSCIAQILTNTHTYTHTNTLNGLKQKQLVHMRSVSLDHIYMTVHTHHMETQAA